MPDRLEFALLRTFRQLFEGTQYKHRDSSLGDLVASQLYEDLVALNRAASAFDEFQILRFRATNTDPFPFEWVDYDQTAKEYSALLVRVSRDYDRRFP